MTERPSWHDYFMGFAEHAASRASCPRAHCGAAIVVGKQVVATGYNGAPPGHPHCIDDGVGCDMEDGHCQRALHAEQNAIGQIVQHGPAIESGTAVLYIYRANATSVGDGPCRECRKDMVAAGIWDYYTVDGLGDLRLRIRIGDQYDTRLTQTKPHPDCTFLRGGWCCLHGNCKSPGCCYHGTKDKPRPMDYICSSCRKPFPTGEYLHIHIQQEHRISTSRAFPNF